MRFTGKVAIVTGAGAGIGQAVALGLAREGAAVVVNDIDARAAEETVATILRAGGQAVSSTVPVGSEEAANTLVDLALSRFGDLHILMNVAGNVAAAPISELTAEMFDRVLKVHLYGTFFNIKAAAARVMIPAGYGKVVNVTSRVGLRGKAGECNYAAAKMGVVGLTLSLAHEFMAHGIQINAVSPAAWTPMAERLPEPLKSQMRQARSQNVLRRVGEAKDVVPTMLFLASDDAAYLTGQIIHVTGQPMALL